MTIFSLDREGHIGHHKDQNDVEQSLEWTDGNNREYIVIDDHGFLYEPIESSDGFYGYK